jgi:hypothetical protein
MSTDALDAGQREDRINFSESTAVKAFAELPKPVESAWRYRKYQKIRSTDPEKAEKMEEHNYFDPEIRPTPDRRRDYKDPAFFRRNGIFERDGEFVMGLVRQGGETIGEVQDLLLLYTNNLNITEDGEVLTVDRFRRPLLRTMALSTVDDQAEKRLTQFSEEAAYHKLVSRYFQVFPEAAQALANSPEFPKLRQQFSEAHIAALHAKPEVAAAAMLAGHYLLGFEDVKAEQSQSQRFIPESGEYHKTIETLLEQQHGCPLPPKPTGHRRNDLAGTVSAFSDDMAKAQMETSRPEYAGNWNAPLKYPGFDMDRCAEEFSETHYEKVILPRLAAEIRRHDTEMRFLDRVCELFPVLVTDPEGRRTLAQALIGNIVMARAEAGGDKLQFTAADWMPFVEGYLGPDKDKRKVPEIGPIPENAGVHEVAEAIKTIFDGGDYETQVQKIYAATPVILSYLCHGEESSQQVRDLGCVISDKNLLAERYLDRLGPIKDQDINVVNRFFREGGLSEAQKFTAYRMAFDFVRGVETNMILDKEGKAAQLERRFGGRWKAQDFSSRPDEEVEAAITKVVVDGDHRISMLNHEPEVVENRDKWTLKDWQEHLETVFAWDVHDMKYLRWNKYWNVYNTALGVAIECICPLRKSIFNPRVFQQW